MSKFLVNKSSGILSLLEGRIQIPIGGHIETSDEQAEHADIISSKVRGWLEVSDVAPGTDPAGVVLPAIVTENDKLKGSLTPPLQAKTVEAVPEEVVTEAPVAEEKPATTKAKK